jgi:hypothetical protein
MARRTLGFRGAARAPKEIGQPVEGVALFEPVSERSPVSECLFEGGDSLVVLIGQVALLRSALEQVRTHIRRQAIAEAKRPRVLCGRLTVRPDRDRTLGRGGCEFEHRRRVADRLRVMGEPRKIPFSVRRLLQGSESRSMEADPKVRVHRFFDDEPRQLVPEGDGVVVGEEHSGGPALLQVREHLAGDFLE